MVSVCSLQTTTKSGTRANMNVWPGRPWLRRQSGSSPNQKFTGSIQCSVACVWKHPRARHWAPSLPRCLHRSVSVRLEALGHRKRLLHEYVWMGEWGLRLKKEIAHLSAQIEKHNIDHSTRSLFICNESFCTRNLQFLTLQDVKGKLHRGGGGRHSFLNVVLVAVGIQSHTVTNRPNK